MIRNKMAYDNVTDNVTYMSELPREIYDTGSNNNTIMDLCYKIEG